MPRPRFSARGEERFSGFLCYEGQVDVFSGEGPLVGAAEQEQCLSEVDRSGVDGVEALDEFAGVAVEIVACHVEKGLRDRQRVRSSWEALAANLRCSPTWASSRSSMVSKASASSRNSSLRPGNRIRCESDPFVAMRVASVMRISGASMRPARIHPPKRPNTRRNASTMAAAGAKARRRKELFPRHQATERADHTVGYVSQQESNDCPGWPASHAAASIKKPASMRNPA